MSLNEETGGGSYPSDSVNETHHPVTFVNLNVCIPAEQISFYP